MRKFSPETEVLLRKAGWKENRVIDTTRYEKILLEEGFEVTDCVIKFLKEFGGLIIRHPHAKVSGTEDYFHLDAAKAARRVDPNWVREDYSQRVGKKLCVIGDAFNEYMVLSMSADGEVFAGFDDILVYVGSSGEEAIEAICSGKELPEILEKD